MLRKLLLLSLLLLAGVVYAAPKQADANIYFLSLSDIHFDPFVSCYGTKRRHSCRLIQLLRESRVRDWSTILKKYDRVKPTFRLDTSYALLKSSLQAAKQAADADHARFVLVLGDSLGHDFRRFYRKYANDPSHQGYQAFLNKVLHFVAYELQKTFPDISVYPLIGNNDTYSRDYASQINGRFFRDAASAWAPLIQEASNRAALQSTLPYAGYYAVNRKAENLKIIFLNSVIFSRKAKGRGIGKAARRQLHWLHQQLALAQKNRQKVLIAMHIPVGIDVYATLRLRLFTLIDLWKPAYAKRFKAELDQYQQEIAGVFSGHMHSDWFQIMTFADGNEVAMTGTPAISPIFGNNPGFKIYQYSLAEQQISDYYTYYLPIEDEHEWRLEYEFDRIYQPNCHLCSLIDGIKKLKLSRDATQHYVRYFAVGRDSRMRPLTTRMNSQYWCKTRSAESAKYQHCAY